MIAGTVPSQRGANVQPGRVRFRTTVICDPPFSGARPPGVLVVDDDLWVRSLLNIVLEEQGIAVWLTANGHDALKVVQAFREEIDLALLDVRMPGLDGPQTLALLQQVNPRLRCCFMTGDPGRYTEEELLQRGAERVIYKPFRLDRMAEIIDRLLRPSASPASLATQAKKESNSGPARNAGTEGQLFDGELP